MSRTSSPPCAAPLPAPVDGSESLIEGELLDTAMRVRRVLGSQLTELHFDDGSQVRISADGAQIDVLSGGDLLVPVLWGPVLLLALARRGVWCLHASSVVLDVADDAALVAMAASGRGKSTLAAVARDSGGAALVDDLCALRIDAQGQLQVLPRLWQLKWEASAHWPAERPQALSVRALGQLQRGKATALSAASEAQLLRLLLQHTVAARLFEPALLSRHLVFCATAARFLTAPGAGWIWTARDSADDPRGAMLELLRQIDHAVDDGRKYGIKVESS